MKITDIVDNIIAKVNLNTSGAVVHNAPAKATPVDADELALLDSAGSFELKKLTWSNLKSVLFDSPVFTGAPKAPTPAVGDNSTKIANTEFVNAEIANDVGVANSSLVKTALNASGSAPIYACRAWVSFNGTGTVAIRASGNVSSITDYGVGFFGVNMAVSIGDSNYSVVASTGQAAGGGNKQPDATINLKSQSEVQIITTGTGTYSYTDNVYNEVVIFR